MGEQIVNGNMRVSYTAAPIVGRRNPSAGQAGGTQSAEGTVEVVSVENGQSPEDRMDILIFRTEWMTAFVLSTFQGEVLLSESAETAQDSREAERILEESIGTDNEPVVTQKYLRFVAASGRLSKAFAVRAPIVFSEDPSSAQAFFTNLSEGARSTMEGIRTIEEEGNLSAEDARALDESKEEFISGLRELAGAATLLGVDFEMPEISTGEIQGGEESFSVSSDSFMQRILDFANYVKSRIMDEQRERVLGDEDDLTAKKREEAKIDESKRLRKKMDQLVLELKMANSPQEADRIIGELSGYISQARELCSSNLPESLRQDFMSYIEDVEEEASKVSEGRGTTFTTLA